MPRVSEIRRYPVKSMAGESLAEVDLDRRGVVGDRWYAVVDDDGRLASGKHSRRFRRRDAVFDFAARTTSDGVRVTGADGEWPAGDPALDAVLTGAMGDPVRVLPEGDTPHHDEGWVSLVGTATLDWCREHWDIDADPRRLRPNLVVETSEPFVEETWTGPLSIGSTSFVVVKRIERCRMVDIAQEGLPPLGGWLKALAETRDQRLAIFVDVVEPGTIRLGDEVLLGGGA
ncbi:MOSC domain-containing protein [Nocardioides cynanchi]|uniref:MOSC domain-containing protein n=1 Tax=Nocardioides cynanchi TaxID=2558918 RepID=UPI0012466F49|nr:MOSC N-terminal beta barrel domain-containing protein [Nocardioides cynanchi]